MVSAKLVVGVILLLLGIVSAAGYLPVADATTNLIIGVVLIIVGLVLIWKRK